MKKLRSAGPLLVHMITTLRKSRYLRIAGLALAGVAVAGVAVAVTASAAGFNFTFKPSNSTQPGVQAAAVTQSTASSTVCADFMHNFATDIGKSQADINAAFQKAISQTLTDEVNNKQITQAQADQIKQKLANQTPCTLASAMPRGHAKAGLGVYMQAYMTAAAGALGITQDQLKTDLANGRSLSQIAAAQHVSEADFRAKLITKLQPTLDAAVTDKKLTADQETAIINRLKTGELPLWNRPTHPESGATPTPTATGT